MENVVIHFGLRTFAHSKGIIHRDVKPGNVGIELSTNGDAAWNDLFALIIKRKFV